MDLKKIQPLRLEWLESTVCKLFCALPKSQFGEHGSKNNPSFKQLMKKDCIGDFWQKPKLLSSFLMSAFHSFLKYPYATTTNSGKVGNTQLQFESPPHGPFFDPSSPLFGFRPILG